MGDTVAIYPLFTKKANEDAKMKMNPRFTKSVWVSPMNANGTNYAFKLDYASTAYTATRV